MTLLDLANELLLSVAANLTCESDINALAQTNRRLYSLLNLVLYRYAVQRRNHSALHWAAFHGLSSIVCMLLTEGASVRAATIRSKKTALHLASAAGHLAIVEALLQMGANANAQSSIGTTPLHEAVWGGFAGVTQALLENGADYMKTLPVGNRPTVLHVASSFGDTTIVQLLLEKGMGIEVRDGDLQTPLHCAIEFDKDYMFWNGNIETVEFLLRHGAKKDAWDKSGQRPKDLAKGHPSTIVELLLQEVSLDEAVVIEKRRQMRKEQEEAKKRKTEELAAERAANRRMRLMREAQKLEKEQLRREVEEAVERQDHAGREMVANFSRQEEQEAIREGWSKMRVEAEKENLRREKETMKQQDLVGKGGLPFFSKHEKLDTTGQAWAKMRAKAEEKSQQPRTIRQSPCPHPALGWLKCKGRAQCDKCGSICAKHSFRCGDCGLVVCLHCKVPASSMAKT